MDYSMIIVVVLVIAVFYFMLIRPENKKKKEAENMRNDLTVGDTVTTIGGMKGKIVGVKEDAITFETSEDRVRVEIAKWGISTTGAMEAAKEQQQQQKKGWGKK